jgi:hypothetical protein
MTQQGKTPAKSLIHEIFLPTIFLPHCPLFPGGKKMMGKNIFDIFEEMNRRNWRDSRALSNLRTDTT